MGWRAIITIINGGRSSDERYLEFPDVIRPGAPSHRFKCHATPYFTNYRSWVAGQVSFSFANFPLELIEVDFPTHGSLW